MMLYKSGFEIVPSFKRSLRVTFPTPYPKISFTESKKAAPPTASKGPNIYSSIYILKYNSMSPLLYGLTPRYNRAGFVTIASLPANTV